ncbi:TetR/AcrR family transcriptional regulator [Paenibacillus mendelii]|uniref:TetR/AcrR family transcriptional regulator n=1 Tax=Paenibacillus mendelii TaxID=206163 RepID=A0ABV6JI83_9BACL|nr:TetR/AcrR family transcriptional regulator [Paenibacillus mendelii]MCQ6557117.1 TetR/AcrR family transcriptional regulator [Paenibacillus mendelii]
MSIIRQKIMESASRHFSLQGYAATSIQEIADDCGIAKGSLYKFFQSKEDLYVAFHDSQHIALETEIESIRSDASRSPREVFILETECHFKFFLNNKFVMHDIKELKDSNGDFSPYFLRLRASHLKFSKDGLTRLLGEDIGHYIWDLVMIYNGIVREFIFLLLFENKPLNVKEVAGYIVDRVEEMAACLVQKKTKPILQEALMNEYMQCEMAGKKISIAAYRTSLLDDLSSTLKELPTTNFRKAELSDAIALLQGELDNDKPKAVIVHALLDFIGKEHELQYIVKQLERLVCLK